MGATVFRARPLRGLAASDCASHTRGNVAGLKASLKLGRPPRKTPAISVRRTQPKHLGRSYVAHEWHHRSMRNAMHDGVGSNPLVAKFGRLARMRACRAFLHRELPGRDPKQIGFCEQADAQYMPGGTMVFTRTRSITRTIANASATDPPGLHRRMPLFPHWSRSADWSARVRRSASPAAILPFAITRRSPPGARMISNSIADDGRPYAVRRSNSIRGPKPDAKRVHATPSKAVTFDHTQQSGRRPNFVHPSMALSCARIDVHLARRT